jgi:hypothetical protein
MLAINFHRGMQNVNYASVAETGKSKRGWFVFIFVL